MDDEVKRDELQQRLVDMEKEIDLKTRYAVHLEGLISEMIPLRRHIKRQVKLRLRTLDQRMTTKLGTRRAYKPAAVTKHGDLQAAAQQVDAANFRSYNRSAKKTLALSLYLSGRQAGINLVSRLLRLRQL